MANNLIHLIKGQLSDNMMGKMASLVGSNSSLVSSAMRSFLPSIVKGIATKGSTLAGAKSILSLITDNKLGGANLGDALGGGSASKNFMDIGSKMASSIFGSNQSSMIKSLASESGLSTEAATSMMNVATPTALHSLSKVIDKGNMGAEDLQTYLKNQLTSETRGTTASRAESTATTTSSTVQESNTGGGMGWLKWLLPLLLLLGLGYFLTRDGGNDDTTATTAKTEVVEKNKNKGIPRAAKKAAEANSHAGHDHSGHDHAGHDHSGHSHGATTTNTNNGSAGFTVDADGNLVDGNGKIVYKKGDFSEKGGEFVDKDGKKIGVMKKIGKAIGDAGKAVGDAAGKVGGAVGDAGKAVGGAVAGAAGKTADAFKNVFGGMFSKKEASFGKTYEMSKITFDPASHRITNFSKNEVEGLAQALKAYPDSKIQVQVHGTESSKDRAQVVHDMLVTLGVSDKQISAKGMGDKDSAKSAAGKVEIMVEGN